MWTIGIAISLVVLPTAAVIGPAVNAAGIVDRTFMNVDTQTEYCHGSKDVIDVTIDRLSGSGTVGGAADCLFVLFPVAFFMGECSTTSEGGDVCEYSTSSGSYARMTLDAAGDFLLEYQSRAFFESLAGTLQRV